MNKFNKFSRAIFTIVLMLCMGFVAQAYDFIVDGICYKKISSTNRTVYVTYHDYTNIYSNYYYNYYYNSCTANVVIPESVTYNGTTYSVTSIDSHAFEDCTNLKSVTIPNSVTSIGNNAFYKCTSLTGVYITDLEAWCKIDFGKLSSNPLYFAKNLYLNNEKVTNLVIPNTITEIKDYAFYCYDGLTSITIPNSVTSIGERAFNYCTNLTSLVIGNSVTTIRNYTFMYCTSLTSVTIPNSVTSIDSHAFYGCI